MIHIVTAQGPEWLEGVEAIASRGTPAYAGGGAHDHFCALSPEQADTLRNRGLAVRVPNDGWYELDGGGGLAVWGDGRYWELRSSRFEVSALGGEGL